MSQGLNKIKRRLSSINSTKKITKAMELVATIKLKKFKEMMVRGSAFSKEIEEIMHDILSSDSEITSPFLNVNKESNIDLYVVINSNLGLCAGFNNGIFKLVDKEAKLNDEIIAIGQKGLIHYSLLKYNVNPKFVSLGMHIEASEIDELNKELINLFLSKKYRSIKLVYTKYINSLTFMPTVFTVFPMSVKKSSKRKTENEIPKFEPDVNTIVDNLVPIYASFLIRQKIIESQVSEQASRRTAMENGANNADDLIDKLTIEYNKARQSVITQEIIEVVSGANIN